MHGELNIGSAGLDADLADDRDRGIAHRLIFAIGECLRRRDGDRVAGVNAHRIEIFDRADDDDVVLRVAHHLELVFFPAQNRFFNQALVDGRRSRPRARLHQFFAVVSNAAAGAAERERWADDDRESDLAGELEAVFQIVDQRRFRHVEADPLHRIFEEKTVFGLLDGVELRANELHVVLFEDAGVGELDGEIQRGLSADRGQHGETRRSATSRLRPG